MGFSLYLRKCIKCKKEFKTPGKFSEVCDDCKSVKQKKSDLTREINKIKRLKKMETMKELEGYTSADVKQQEEEIKGVILDIKKKKAKEIFGDKANNPEDDVLILDIQNQEKDLRIEDVMTQVPKEKLTTRSKLGRFLKKYNQLKIGMVVDLKLNNEGFYKINV